MYKINIAMCTFALVFSLALSGCQRRDDNQVEQTTNEPENIDPTQIPSASFTLEPYIFSTSTPGTITVKGYLLVLDPVVMRPDPNDAIFLVPMPGGAEGVTTIPPFVIGEVPQAEVDERTGDFVFTDIQPGRYAVVVLTTGGAQIPARFYEQGSLAIVSFDSTDIDKLIELEYLSLP